MASRPSHVVKIRQHSYPTQTTLPSLTTVKNHIVDLTIKVQFTQRENDNLSYKLGLVSHGFKSLEKENDDLKSNLSEANAIIKAQRIVNDALYNRLVNAEATIRTASTGASTPVANVIRLARLEAENVSLKETLKNIDPGIFSSENRDPDTIHYLQQENAHLTKLLADYMLKEAIERKK